MQENEINNGVSDSLIRIELITHFHRNPGLEGTCYELAARIGRDEARVENQVKKLVHLNILDERLCEGKFHYRYIPPYSISVRDEGESDARSIHDEDGLESESIAADGV